jgi:hypothetical protein
MRTFGQILIEAKSRGTLYHITNYVGLRMIFETDEMKSNTMSLTRDKNLWFFNGCPPQTFFQLEIDGDKLSENYKIFPYADKYTEIGTYSRKTKYYSNEREERIEDSTGKYFHGFWTKYVKKVNFNQKIFYKDFRLLGGDCPGETEDFFGTQSPKGFYLNVFGECYDIRHVFLKDYITLLSVIDKPIEMVHKVSNDHSDVIPYLKSLLNVKFD